VELKHIVESYIQGYRAKEHDELHWHRHQPSLTAAIEVAALADYRGKRHSHQQRLQRVTLEKGRNALLQAKSAIRGARSFDELHSLIESKVSSIKGIGELYIYDTAVRIGVKLNLLPDKVYLHRGTRQGARALGLRGAGPLQLSELPSEFRKMEAHEIEDLLCSFRDCFGEDKETTSKVAEGHGCYAPKAHSCRLK
jgi:hypothetical protein